jgi:Domain of unknown function (DUF6456)
MTLEPAPDASTRRLLKSLSARGAWLELCATRADAKADYRLASATPAQVIADVRFPADLVSQAVAKGWILQGESRVTLTPAGARSLRRALAGGPAGSLPKLTESQPTRARTPTRAVDRSPAIRRQPVEDSPGFNEAESPLGWLRRRMDRRGQPLIGDQQFAAGERLRADVFFAGLAPRVTASWSSTAGTSSGRRSAPGGADQMLDSMVAARERVQRALRAVGPELSGILLDVCGFMKGLEDVESERGWPPRTGKVVLLLALARLAAHYGLTRPGGDGTEQTGAEWAHDGAGRRRLH